MRHGSALHINMTEETNRNLEIYAHIIEKSKSNALEHLLEIKTQENLTLMKKN